MNNEAVALSYAAAGESGVVTHRLSQTIMGQNLNIGLGDNQDTSKPRTYVFSSSDTIEIGDSIPDRPILAFDGGLEVQKAVTAPLLAAALKIFDVAEPDIGSPIAVSGNCIFASLLCEVGHWWSPNCTGLVSLTGDDPAFEKNPKLLRVGDADTPSTLETRLAAGASPIIIDLEGGSDTLDVIFGAIPYWTTIVACSQRHQEMTIDFYNNVHRKGVRIQGLQFTPSQFFDPAAAPYTDSHIQRAIRLLSLANYSSRLPECVGLTDEP